MSTFQTRRRRCGLPISGGTFCSMCGALDAVAKLASPLDHVTGEIRRTQGLLTGNDALSEMQRAVSESQRWLEPIGEMPRLGEERDLVDQVQAWQHLQADQMRTITQTLESGLEAVSRIQELTRFRPSLDELTAMVASAGDGWRDLIDSATTSYALTSMASLAKAIDSGPFSDDAVAALRSQLGDWTGVTLSADVFDASRRQQLYDSIGLEPRLVIPEPEVVDVLLGVTQIRPRARPPLRPTYISADLRPEEESEDRLHAEDCLWLFRFESQIRAFIDRVMSAAWGSRWIVQKVPGKALAGWRDRREDQRRAKGSDGAHQALLTYAHLGDYVQIICRSDNWRYFQPYFCRKELVQESFTRLAPLRKDLAHSRTLSRADRLYFYAEIHRLWVAFGGSPDHEDCDE